MIYGKKIIGTVAYMGGIMTLPEPFVWSWSQMIQYNSDYLVQPNEQVYYYRATVSYHSYARNHIVDAMRGDWVLMLDTDLKFDPDIVARMVNQMNKDNLEVLGGLYQYKAHPHTPLVYRFSKKKDKGIELVGRWDVPKGKGNYLVPVDAMGAGCLMVKKSVFNRIKSKLKENPFDISHPLSEDLSFFKRLKKLKIQPYLCPQIEAHHLRFEPLSIDKYNWNNVPLGKRIKTL